MPSPAQIITQLRQSRLFPVIGVLVAALIAIPLVLAKHATAPAPEPLAGVPAAAPPATAVPAVSVTDVPSRSRLSGRSRDPFTQQRLPMPKLPQSSSSSGSSGAAASPGSSGSAGASGPAPSTAGPSDSTSGSSTPTVHLTYFYYTVDLAFGRIGRKPQLYGDVARLTPLPTDRNPLLVFLGLRQDARTALFLVSSTASPAGPGTCLPSPRQCTFLELAVGQAEALLVQTPNGSVVEDQLALTAVHVRQTSSPTAAARANSRVSAAGQQIVSGARRQEPHLPWPTWNRSSGLLTFHSRQAPRLVHLGRLSAGRAAGVTLEPVHSRRR